MTKRRAVVALSAVLAAAACEGPRATPCSGEPVGTFVFRGVPSGGGTCGFDASSPSFTATISYTGETTAVLCIDRAEAAPLSGTRAGDHVTLASGAAAANVSACTCDISVVETVEGDVVRADGGSPTFEGTLRNEVDRADGGTQACDADGGSVCDVPCELEWTLTGS